MADLLAPSLLEKLQYPPSPGTRKRIKENFSLGMKDWDSDISDFQPLARAKRKCHGDSPKCFAEPTSAEALESTSKDVVPKNTQKSDGWARQALNEWITERNKHCSEKCPRDILETEVLQSGCHCLLSNSGKRMVVSTLLLQPILCGLQRIMRRNNSHPFDIFDKKDVRFRHFHGTMETNLQILVHLYCLQVSHSVAVQ